MSAPFSLPGYTWDGKRFFKSLPGTTASPRSSYSTESNLDATNDGGETRRRKKKRVDEVKKSTETCLKVHDFALVGRNESERRRFNHNLRRMTWNHHESSDLTTIYPDCLTMDDEILRISFDQTDPNLVRIGTKAGLIATGSINPTSSIDYQDFDFTSTEADHFSSDWRTSWYLSSSITSLNTFGQRFLATSFGLPAQAIIGTTTDSISLASVTLSPRKTSLWTSAISDNLLALGCDRKVLISQDLERTSMDGYVTGSKNGSGTVFALEIAQNMIFAGTRKGQIKLFDPRSTKSSSSSSTSNSSSSIELSTRSEQTIDYESCITHLKLLSNRNQLVVGCLNGVLELLDLRFLESNSTSFSSSGSYSSTLSSNRDFSSRLNQNESTQPFSHVESSFRRSTPWPNSSFHSHSSQSPRTKSQIQNQAQTRYQTQTQTPIRTNRKRIHNFSGHSNSITRELGMTLSPHEDFLLLAGEDGYVRIWDLIDPGGKRVLPYELGRFEKNRSKKLDNDGIGTSNLIGFNLNQVENWDSNSNEGNVLRENFTSSKKIESLLSTKFSSPIKSISFGPARHIPSSREEKERIDSQLSSSHSTFDRLASRSRTGIGDEKSEWIWLTDGGSGLKGFGML